jgi:hypothetical protein
MEQQHIPAGASGGKPLDAARLDAWVAAAQPRARLLYHVGYHAGDAGHALLERLRRHEARGMLYLVQQRRERGGFDYLAVRSSRPAGAGRPRRAGLHEQARALFNPGAARRGAA